MGRHRNILRMGLVGGGPGSMIGGVHRMADELDGGIRLVAGAFSRDAEKSREAARAFGLDEDRAYTDVNDLLAHGAQGLDLITVATPNDTHLPIVLSAIKAGVHVICDKPATRDLDEALTLQTALAGSAVVYGLTYTYTGQIAAGDHNNLTLKVWGELGGIEWQHAKSDQLVMKTIDGRFEILHDGMARLSPEASLLPGITEGVRSMVFVETALASSRARTWLDLNVTD